MLKPGKKILYFVCPTDFLEPIINNTFKQESYYYNTLGNSIAFDNYLIGHLKNLINSKKIKEISFVLSVDNRIISNAIENNEDIDYLDIKGLSNFYRQLSKQQKNIELSWNNSQHQSLILSYHLNQKIKELKLGLSNIGYNKVKVNGKIYHRPQKVFSCIYPDIICLKYFSLN